MKKSKLSSGWVVLLFWVAAIALIFIVKFIFL